ncbi:hypothetical protein JW960_10260 [candidate division KSB1 bacterium]|nr:hypothetical protein [candidate division KSB1 bacterium]
MNLVMDTTFKRIIVIVVCVAIAILLLYTAFFYLSGLKQQFVVVYFLIIQIVVFLTFFAFRDQFAYRHRSVKKLKNPRLQENSFELAHLLMSDYEYIRETASQAMNDRHTMVNYFLLIVGASVTILAATVDKAVLFSGSNSQFLAWLALILNFIGWIYFLIIIRLRQAWCGSALAMNQIKEFYIQNGRVPDDIARSAFLWDTKSVPSAGRKSTVFYYSAVLISFISSIVLIFASFISVPAKEVVTIPVFSILLGLYHFVFQVICYSLFLDYTNFRR